MAADVNIVVGAQDRASQVLEGVATRVGQMQAGFKSLGPVAAGAAGALAAVTAGIVAFNQASQVILERAKEIDELAKAAARVGESVGGLQAFQFALGEIAGVDAETARQALAELRKSIGEAIQGDQGKIDVLAQLGLDAQSLSQGGPVQAFEQIKEAIGGIENASQRAAIAEKLLGGEARKLMGLLSDQSDAFSQSMQAASDLGLAISDAGAAGVEAMNDALGRASAVMQGLVTQVTVELAPAVEILANHFTEVATSLGDSGVSIKDLVDGGIAFAGITYDIVGNLKEVTDLIQYISTFGSQGDLTLDFDYEMNTAQELLEQVEARRAEHARNAANRAAQRIAEQRAIAEATADTAAKEVAAEEAKATSGEKTIEQLEKQLAILSMGREEYERMQQLASATTDAERAKIAALQQQIASREELNQQIEEAEQEAAAIREAMGQGSQGITATEGRLITRGNVGSDQKKALQAAENSLAELTRIREYMERQEAPGGGIELVMVGGL